MIFGTSNKTKIPDTPVPTFMLTETCSTIATSDASEQAAGSTELSTSLDKRLAELQKSVSEQSPEVVKVLLALGDACVRNEDYQESLQYYTQALEATKKVSPEGHPDIADVLSSIGFVSAKLSMPKESLSNLTAALDIFTKAYSDRSWATEKDGSTKLIDYSLHRRIASTRSALGSCEFQQKNYAKSKKYFEDALLESKRSAVAAVVLNRAKSLKHKPRLSESRIHVSEIFNNLASVCTEQGDKATAIQNYNSALALQMQEAGEDNPSVACTLHNIGTMHYRSGEFQFALKSYKQVLKMSRFLYGNEDIRIAECLLNIATVHEQAEEFERCVSALSAANRITAKYYGNNSIEYGVTTQRLGDLYARTNCNDLSIDHFESALGIYRRAGLDDSHPSVEAVHNSINFVKCKGNEDVSNSGIISSTKVWGVWGDVFNSGCGSFCFATDNNTSPFEVTSGINDHGITSPSAASNFVTV
jgi:tetratricopeptide (TPR) repeat protein